MEEILNKITNQQLQHLKDAHADGLLDKQIAERAGISLTTAKRYRKSLGLETHCITAQRGKLGERITAMYAAEAGLSVTWRTRDNDAYDLIINGKLTDAKTSMMLMSGTWRFRLLDERTSHFGLYSYPKDLAADSEVVAFVCLFPDSREPEIYLMSSGHLPASVRIRPGESYEPSRDDWDLFRRSPALMA